MSTLLAFLRALPELFKLFKVLDARIKQANLDRKVSEDVKVIHEAFDAKNPDSLRTLFNS